VGSGAGEGRSRLRVLTEGVCGDSCRLESREPNRIRLAGVQGARTGNVHVDEAVYDISTLNPGDKIRVDFFAPDQNKKGLKAATI